MWKFRLMTLAASATAMSVGAIAAAASPPSSQGTIAADSTAVEQVQYRGGGGWGGGGRGVGGGGRGWGGGGWRGPGIGLGIGAGLVAGAIIADRAYAPRRGYYYDTYDYAGPYYYPEGYSGDPRRVCAQNFRSFEWETGMYTTYGGERRVCPYL